MKLAAASSGYVCKAALIRAISAVLLCLVTAACSTGSRPPTSPVVQVQRPAPVPVHVDFVLVEKSVRRITLLGHGRPLRIYENIQFGDAPSGHKQFEGDERTSEGRYVLDYRNPQSSYHLSLHISYPDANDRAFAQRHGYSPGGQIFIHGQPNNYPEGQRVPGDWTDGCIALANHEIEDMWRLVADGTPIEIRP